MEEMDYLMVALLGVLYASLFIIFKYIIVLSKRIEKEYCDAIFSTVNKKMP